jgi:hypothetical protein
MSDKNIWTRRHEIDKARQEKMKEVMAEYDRKVYNPARKQLVEDCEKEGHTQGKFHDNGFGWTWWYCGKCGTSFNKERA